VRPLATTALVDAGGGRRPASGQVFRLRREQLLGKDPGERLADLHKLARGIHIKLFDPSGDTGVDVRDARFIRDDGRRGPD